MRLQFKLNLIQLNLITGKNMLVGETLPRNNLWAVQTPHVFRFGIIAEAHRRAQAEATDDAALVERMGHGVKLYMGAYDNIKITTPEDLALAGLLWRQYGK